MTKKTYQVHKWWRKGWYTYHQKVVIKQQWSAIKSEGVSSFGRIHNFARRFLKLLKPLKKISKTTEWNTFETPDALCFSIFKLGAVIRDWWKCLKEESFL